MSDIRERIEDDRGLLKKIQMFVPGFRGYRIKEDLRDADRMLRNQLADNIGLLCSDIENARSMMPIKFNSKDPEYIGGIINSYKKLESLVRHAEFGHSGIAADISFKEDELNRLYEFDLKLFENLDDIKQVNNCLKSHVVSGSSDSIVNETISIRNLLDNFETEFNRRIDVVQSTVVKQ